MANFTVLANPLPDFYVVSALRRQDDRGFFEEVFRASLFSDLGLPTTVVQVNHSRSNMGVTRGLHFQWQPAMGKTMRVTRGEAYLVAVDIRPDSPTLGQWYGHRTTEEDSTLLIGPAGFARGFQSLSEVTDVEYFTTGEYNGACESGIRWNDPAIGIEWPLSSPVLSDKDAVAPGLAEWLSRPEASQFST